MSLTNSMGLLVTYVSILMLDKSVCIIQNSIKTLYIFRKQYILRLLSNGYSVHCFAVNDSDEHVTMLETLGCVVHSCRKSNFLFSSIYLNFKVLFFTFNRNEKAPLIIHFISSFVMFFPSILCNRKRTFVVIEGIGSFFTNRAIFSKIISYLVRHCSSKRVFMNQQERQLLGFDSDLVLKGIGIDVEHFRCSEVSQRTKSHRILYVGRLVGDKGIYDILELGKQLKQRKVDFHIDIVGDIYPSNPSSLTESDIVNSKVFFGADITFHGFKSDLREFYSSATVLILPSRHEGFPVVVMEANAMGVPVICYDVIGCRDAICHGVNGYLVEPFAIDDIRDIIVQGEYKFISESAIRYARENFDSSTKTDIFLKYLGLVKN